MIFMNKETGDLFELMILSLDDNGMTYVVSGQPAYGMGEFTLYGNGSTGVCRYSEMGEKFHFIGVL